MSYKDLEIKPCLHCGGEGKLKGRKKHRVICTKCGAQGAEKPLVSQAVAAWNMENIVVCRDCKNYEKSLHVCEESGEMISQLFDDEYCENAERKENI